MLKRAIIAIVLGMVTILILGFMEGFSNLKNFLPLVPPFLAITLTFITHEVLVSLFLGIFLGSVMTYEINSFGGFFINLGKGFFKSIDTYILKGLVDNDHMSIIVFTSFIGGTISLVGVSGGLHGIVVKLAKYARTSVLAQFYTWLLGVLIFFDDYANTLIVGNTMRPITDKFRVSREKLSYLVDATAAPVTSLVLVSTWIGYEIGLIQDAFKAQGITVDPYVTFIESIPYRFYAIMLLIFIPIGIFMKRDMFSMYDAEKRSRETGDCLKKGTVPISGEELHDMELKEGMKPRVWNAIIPIMVLLVGVLIGLYYTGKNGIITSGGEAAFQDASLKDILAKSNSFVSLIWSSVLSSAVIIMMIVFQKVMSIKDAMQSWLGGVKSMVPAMIILSLAWGLGSVLKDIKTAECVTTLVSSNLSVGLLPLSIFLVSAIISFATGTSWGTMAILFPIAIPLTVTMTSGMPSDVSMNILFASVGSILSGSIFGDHCSPISDTTIMSSIASSIDHMDHVSTQMPYAVMIGIVSCLIGYLPCGFGMNPWLANILGILVLTGIMFFAGKKVDNLS
jgi:Na+/H+ antiporter NhaC